MMQIGGGRSATARPREELRLDFDVVIVGASLAGCATAILLGRAGARVALIDKQPGPEAFKRICTHNIQPSALPTLERLGLLDEMMAAGAVRTSQRIWTRWGWNRELPGRMEPSVSLRREKLDPLVREAAAAVPGVELTFGRTAQALLRDGNDGNVVRGVLVRDRDGTETDLRADLVVGADGRGSRVAELAGLSGRTRPHGRFYYGAYFEDPAPPGSPDVEVWLLDPDFAARFPTDEGLALYAVMPTKDRLPDFKRNPDEALVSFVAGVPDAPPIRELRRVGPTFGKLEMPNRVRGPVAPGLALAGDAALAIDPLYGTGCGWAFQSGEWLADSVTPALRGEEPLERGLCRYRTRRRRELLGHSFMLMDYATGRRFNPLERTLFAGASRCPHVAAVLDELGTRRARPGRAVARALPRAIAVNALHAVSR